MARYEFIVSKVAMILVLIWLNSSIVHTSARSKALSALDAPNEIVQMLIRDPVTLSLASTDFGHIIHENPLATFAPSSISDISQLIKFSNSLSIPFTIAARGEGHSVNGQSMARDGVVVNMTELRNNGGGSSIVFVVKEENDSNYVDVGGEAIWIDVLHASLERGLTPLSWTDYLYLSVGGTLSNAGISGQTFRFGPQISNVHEMDVVTGKGDLVTCSSKKNSELFYAVLGGLGQFGIITRARIALGRAPKRVKWLHLLYNNFSAFSSDQEHLISFNGRNETNAADYVEGMLLLNKSDLSFYPTPDQPRITSLVTQHNIVYILELVKYYDDSSQDRIDQEIETLVKGLKFVPTFMFEKDVSYEEFLNRVHFEELSLREKGLWDVPHPWLNLFVPGSRISDFDEGVFKGILLEQNNNITTGLATVYPINRTKWDDKVSAVTPNEEIFYVVSLLRTAGFDKLEAFQAQNQHILKFCVDAGIGIKHYLPHNLTREEWVEQFGLKWKVFEQRKAQFDPNRILSPGQGIFN